MDLQRAMKIDPERNTYSHSNKNSSSDRDDRDLIPKYCLGGRFK
ncbi:hypothetical protein PSFL111601_09365 [Pseudomonas floridensis]